MGSPDFTDLLDGLEGDARAERAELIGWLLEQGITTDQIRDAYAPLLLASRRVLGDDGTLVSAREISETTGIDLALLRRIQRAIGLPTSDDPDARIHPTIDGDITSYVVKFMDLGFDEDRIVAVIRVIADGLAKTAEAIRYTALSAMMASGSSELEIAKASEAMLRQADPLLGPMIQDMLKLQLRHTMETEAVTASERAKGLPLPGAGPVAVAFADLVGFTRLGEAVPPEELEDLAHRLVELTYDVVVPPVRFIKSIGDAVMLISPDPVPLLDTMLALVDATEAGEDFLRLARRRHHRLGREPRRGLVRQPGEPGQPDHRRRPAGLGAGVRSRARSDRRRRRIRVVLRGCAAAQGHQGRRQTVPGSPDLTSASAKTAAAEGCSSPRTPN